MLVYISKQAGIKQQSTQILNKVKKMVVNSNGPFLNAALLCEKVLQEKDETVSIIRTIDRITLTTQAMGSPETLPPVPIALYAFISLKSGSARGKHVLKWITEAPSGIRSSEQLLPVLFEGEDRGVNIILALNMIVDQEGIYWFDLLLEDRLLTRLPLRVLYQRIGQNL
jgi:hypothetical protein